MSDTTDAAPEYDVDNLSKAGAQHLAARLDAYWHAQGHTTVRHWAVATPGRHATAAGIWVVRSNLVRGQPPR
jgi:hypothetical protein